VTGQGNWVGDATIKEWHSEGALVIAVTNSRIDGLEFTLAELRRNEQTVMMQVEVLAWMELLEPIAVLRPYHIPHGSFASAQRYRTQQPHGWHKRLR